MKPPQWVTDFLAEPNRPLLVGEVKTCSPYGFRGKLSHRDALDYVASFADIVSIHTNPLWGGSFEWLQEARGLTTKPILAKGFHDTMADVVLAFRAGAEWTLTVGWHPGMDYSLGGACWHEVANLAELDESNAEWCVWNARNPRTGKPTYASIRQARKRREGKLCQASRIRCRADIHPGIDAVLIGEGLYV